ncbi:MAG: response regulator [Candidatus Eremiobacteraeota bacterium]|nr:response regulator [Candidatus Eremiobacteraeota bacterium]
MNKCLLIIDDNKIARMVLSRQLGQAGYEIEEAATGPLGLTCLMRRPVDLVLLDFVMQPLTGLDVLQRLRRGYSPQELPVFMMSSTKDDRLVQSAIALGVNDFFFRPFQLSDMLERVHQKLDDRA